MENEANKPQETAGGNENLEKNTENFSEQENEVTLESTELEASENTDAPIQEDEVQDEIDKENAEDAEDTENEKRHEIPFLDYHSMSMENLVGELQKLVKNEKVQAINKHVNAIKQEFDQKFRDFLEEKKEEFIDGGGNEIDFRYNSVTKRQFNEVYKEYREKRDTYYRNLEKSLQSNLENRLAIIEELKSLVNVEEDINTTYKNFKELQEKWRNAGPVPRNSYNDVWRTYHHHMEIFYDFLHLNRELRDLDFRHNLEEKQKLIARAEALVSEPDLNKAFRELQTLHKVWKEEIGPVAKEIREEVWEKFSTATKAMHARRQEYFASLEEVYEENLVTKNEIIAKIKSVSENVANSHKGIQNQIKEIEALREEFFKAGKVPQRVNEETWARFKEAVRKFNKKKNGFYKELKKEQQDNLDKKRALLEIAESLKDSEDMEKATPEMKRIQNEWKKIGHVPRKYSDKIWNEFKAACNHYFDRLHAQKKEDNKEEFANFEAKSELMEKLKAFQLSGDREKDLPKIKTFIADWKKIGHVPYNKRHINSKFNKIIDALFKKLDISKQESELLKYGDKIKQLANADDNERAIGNERVFIKRKIDESKSEIRQLENNLQFFSNASEDNPLVKDVINNINRHKEALDTWKTKLKNLNIMENKLAREEEEQAAEDNNSSEEE
ncbi:chromosome segregation protein [Croceivirga radicis]|uniref:Chromosome segregation protein n=1 Tax=Croceivirga radicis TaxID=1929488 RepID=A0A1V6LQV2_9FLAO|nr:DUF349 domain-containing protein [Croceivirga radicis]OQD42336.1 chromosome segregation protein [Croceivirga radicis]